MKSGGDDLIKEQNGPSNTWHRIETKQFEDSVIVNEEKFETTDISMVENSLQLRHRQSLEQNEK